MADEVNQPSIGCHGGLYTAKLAYIKKTPELVKNISNQDWVGDI